MSTSAFHARIGWSSVNASWRSRMATPLIATYGKYRPQRLAPALFLRLAMAFVLVLSVMSMPGPAHAQSGSAVPVIPGPCNIGPLPGGSLGMICIPLTGWNGDLIVWAHGYRAFNESL